MDQHLGLALKLGVYAACYRSCLEGGGALLLRGWHTGLEGGALLYTGRCEEYCTVHDAGWCEHKG